jgi:hypothetical protein
MKFKTQVEIWVRAIDRNNLARSANVSDNRDCYNWAENTSEIGALVWEELCLVTIAETVGKVAEKKSNIKHHNSEHLVGFNISQNSS